LKEKVAEWLRVARADWQRAMRMLEDEDTVAAGFFLQQSLEKYLKAFLIERGWSLRKIHELEALLDDAVKYQPGLDAFYDLCERVSGYYLADRCPPLGVPEIPGAKIEDDLLEARKLITNLFPDERPDEPLVQR
jgi:HEPN domain-containing protein